MVGCKGSVKQFAKRVFIALMVDEWEGEIQINPGIEEGK